MSRSTKLEKLIIDQNVYKADISTGVNTNAVNLQDFNNIANRVKTIVFDVVGNSIGAIVNFTTDAPNGFKVYNSYTKTFDTPILQNILPIKQSGSIDFYLNSSKTAILAIQRVPTILNDSVAKYVNDTTDLTINYNVTIPINFIANGTIISPLNGSFTINSNGITPNFDGRIILGAQIPFSLNTNNGGLQAFFDTDYGITSLLTQSFANVENTNNSNRAMISILSIVNCNANQNIRFLIGREPGNTVTGAGNVLRGARVFASRLA